MLQTEYKTCLKFQILSFYYIFRHQNPFHMKVMNATIRILKVSKV